MKNKDRTKSPINDGDTATALQPIGKKAKNATQSTVKKGKTVEDAKKENKKPKAIESKFTNVRADDKKDNKRSKVVKPKLPRKSFSLAGMIETKNTPVPSSSVVVDLLERPGRTEVKVEEPKWMMPKWMMNYHPTRNNEFESNPIRVFGMEFLMDAVKCLPKENGNVDPPSVARALEDALYTKYDGEEKYMEHLHDVCAAIAGKKKMGSVAQKIMSGDYATPLDVINIPRKLLFQSFEGFWIP